jgi:hypothetical protein
MAKRPRNKKVDSSMIDQGAITPIRALAAALINRRDRKEDREYQESLEDMGMFEDGGGRANVPISKDKMYMAPPKDMRREFRDQKRKPKQKEYLMEKKSTGGKMRSADGIAIKGKTRLSMKGYGKIG